MDMHWSATGWSTCSSNFNPTVEWEVVKEIKPTKMSRFLTNQSAPSPEKLPHSWGMAIFFDDGGVGRSNGQTGWWIAEEESFGENCLLWCPGALAEIELWSGMESLKLSIYHTSSKLVFVSLIKRVEHDLQTDYWNMRLKVVHLKNLGLCFFEFFKSPGPKSPRGSIELFIPKALLFVCLRRDGNGVATWVGMKWTFTCYTKILHRTISGE